MREVISLLSLSFFSISWSESFCVLLLQGSEEAMENLLSFFSFIVHFNLEVSLSENLEITQRIH